MKKPKRKSLSLTICVLATVLCLAACGGGDSGGNESSSAQSALVGTWAANEAEGMAYIFNEDGTGQWDMGGAAMDFTYVDNGGTVEITYEGASAADQWAYTISGDTLTMKDDDTGSTLTYTKK